MEVLMNEVRINRIDLGAEASVMKEKVPNVMVETTDQKEAIVLIAKRVGVPHLHLQMKEQTIVRLLNQPVMEVKGMMKK